MSRPKAMDVAVRMVKYAEERPVIPYAQYDCYNIVRRAVETCGGSMRYSGSNNVYRNGVKNLMPLGDAIAKGLLKAGWVLFIVRPESEKLPAQYRGDGRQDAYHMGIYADMRGGDGVTNYEVVHSSASRGGVYPSTLKNAWNWAAELVDVDYSDWHAEGPSDFSGLETDAPAPPVEVAAPYELRPGQAIVVSDTLRARKTLSTRNSSNVVMEMKRGRVLTDVRTGFWFDSGEPAVSGMIAGARHPRVYAAVMNPATGERYLRVYGEGAEG